MLLKVPSLVKRLEERDPEFVSAVKSWLANAGEVFGRNGLSQTAEIAVCRSNIIAAERGLSEDGTTQTRIGARAFKEARAGQLLERATDLIADSVRPRRAQVDEAGRIMLQVVAVADQLGLIPTDTGSNHAAYLQTILSAMTNRAELVSLVVHITGLVGKADILIVLDRSIASLNA